MASPRLYVASDHAGFALKRKLIEGNPALPWADMGPSTDDRVDYPDFADLVAREVAKEFRSETQSALWDGSSLRSSAGVLVCGSGQGMAIRANRNPLIRAALAWNVETAKLARAHNDANVLCLGERLTPPELAQEILRRFLTEPFEGGRHSGRVSKLGQPC